MNVTLTYVLTEPGERIPVDVFEQFIGCGMNFVLDGQDHLVTLHKAVVSDDGRSVDVTVDIPGIGNPN